MFSKTLPLAGSATVTGLTESVSPSMSLSLISTLPVKTTSSLVIKVSSVATGESLTGLMVIVAVATAEVAPSGSSS